MGSSVPLSPTLCASIRDLLDSTEQDSMWSRRSVDRISQIRQHFPDHFDGEYFITRKGKSLEWWTFAGLIANQTVVQFLQPYFESPLRADNLWIKLPQEVTMEQLRLATLEILSDDDPPNWELQEPANDFLKFGDLLPNHLLRDLILARIADVISARKILSSYKWTL